MRRLLVLGLLLLGGLLAPAAAEAKVFYTTPSGSDAADCLTKETACSLKTGLIQNSNDPTDRIEVGTGDYSDFPVTTFTDVFLPIAGEPGAPRPTIRATNTIRFLDPASHLDVRGSSLNALATFTREASDVDVRNSGNTEFATGCLLEQGLARLSNALCVGGSYGVRLTDQSLTNVTAAGSAGVRCDASCTLRNVLVLGAFDVEDGATATAVTSAWTTRAGLGSVTSAPVTGVPAFEAEDGFKPVSTAATIDAGSGPVSGEDLDGNARSLGAAPDIGAYESRRAYVVAGATTDVTDTTAKLHATVTTNGFLTTWTWTRVGGGVVPGDPYAEGPVATHDATLTLTGLQPGTTYSYVIVATNAAGSSVPVTLTATTTGVAPVPGGGGVTPTPSPTPTPTVTPTPTATPVTGKLKVTGPSKAAARRLVRRGKAARVTITCPTACATRVKGEVRAGKKRLGRTTAPAKALRISANGTGRISVTASKALRRKVAAFKRRKPKAKITLVLRVTTTPGAARTLRITVT